MTDDQWAIIMFPIGLTAGLLIITALLLLDWWTDRD